MRKDLGNKMQFMPLPVLMLATYDQDGKANVMNAAWGGVYDYNQVYVSLSKHKTTDNLELKKAFTLSFATKKTEKFLIISVLFQEIKKIRLLKAVSI